MHGPMCIVPPTYLMCVLHCVAHFFVPYGVCCIVRCVVLVVVYFVLVLVVVQVVLLLVASEVLLVLVPVQVVAVMVVAVVANTPSLSLFLQNMSLMNAQPLTTPRLQPLKEYRRNRKWNQTPFTLRKVQC